MLPVAPLDAIELLEDVIQVFRSDRQRAGAGLGLSICRGLVEAHGGRIYARLPEQGPGAIFHIELPVVDSPPVEEEIVEADA